MPMTQEQKILYKAIDEILWRDWDPINVNDDEEWRDEYSSYTPQVFNLKIKNADKETIAQHLLKIETGRMGFKGSIDGCRQVADKIIKLSINQ